MAEHDDGYKLLFSHPEMVADLLRGFVHEDWVRDLDFSTLEKVPGSYVTPESAHAGRATSSGGSAGREDRGLYVYLLIEFQSTVDPFMALRMMVYLGLLYQDLLQRREPPPSGKLPPVLPLVLYNGYAPWGAAREVSELIEEVPGGLERYRPQLRYCLLDEMRIADSELESLRNLAAALFRLEKSPGPEDVQRVLAALIEWLREPGLAELRRSFTDWVLRGLLPARVRGVSSPGCRSSGGQVDACRTRHELDRPVEAGRDRKGAQGIEKGIQQGLTGRRGSNGAREGDQRMYAKARGVLLRDLESGASVLCPRRSGGGWRRSPRSRRAYGIQHPGRRGLPPWPISRLLDPHPRFHTLGAHRRAAAREGSTFHGFNSHDRSRRRGHDGAWHRPGGRAERI